MLISYVDAEALVDGIKAAITVANGYSTFRIHFNKV